MAQMTRQEARDYLDSVAEVEPVDDDAAYDWGGRQAGKTILAFLETHPEARALDVWEISAALDAAEVQLPEGLTGFQFGYAVNMAKYVLDEPLVPNPAIMIIDASDD